jgi:hypothetical protein
MSLEKTLEKWYSAKEKLAILEEKINKYKLEITREMNRKNVDKISAGGFTVSRRRNTRTYLSKESVPADIWKEYSTRCSFDAFFLVKN